MIEFSLQKELHAANGSMLFNISHTIMQGAFVGVYGSSGAGKTSLLRMIAGFLVPQNGFIKVNNVQWYNSEQKINLAPQKRKIGFVFQDYALFPNMTVKENLLYALHKETKPTIVEELLGLVELDQLQNRKIQTLSGGQQQRVALARALMRKPDLLLLDEPLSALDTILREKMQVLILELHKKFQLTTILVTHDLSEITRLADEVIFIKDGAIEKSGSPVEIFASKESNGTFQITAVVVDKVNDELCLLIGKDLVRVKVNEEDMRKIEKGSSVIVELEAERIKIKNG